MYSTCFWPGGTHSARGDEKLTTRFWQNLSQIFLWKLGHGLCYSRFKIYVASAGRPFSKESLSSPQKVVYHNLRGE
jgi:hypothetical protein